MILAEGQVLFWAKQCETPEAEKSSRKIGPERSLKKGLWGHNRD